MFVYRKNVLGYTRLNKRCYTSTKHELKISKLKNGCEKSCMKSNKVRPVLPTPIGPFGENCSKENVTWISDDYYISLESELMILFLVYAECGWPSFGVLANTKAHQVFEGESVIAVETMSTETNWQLETRKGHKRGKTVRYNGAEVAHEKRLLAFSCRGTDVGDGCGAKGNDYGKAKFPSSDLSLRFRFPEQMTKYPRISDLLGTKKWRE